MKKQTDLPMAAAVRFLGTTDRTEAELRQHLERKTFSASDIDRVVEWAKTKKYVSDQRVADREVEVAKGVKLVGKGRVLTRLLKRGASDDVVEQAVERYTEAEEDENALALVEKKFATTDDPAKIARFLLGRGFEEDTVRRTLSTFIPGFEW